MVVCDIAIILLEVLEKLTHFIVQLNVQKNIKIHMNFVRDYLY